MRRFPDTVSMPARAGFFNVRGSIMKRIKYAIIAAILAVGAVSSVYACGLVFGSKCPACPPGFICW